MTPSEHCLKEKSWGVLEEKCQKYDAHIKESEKDGGYRERLIKTEFRVKGLLEAQKLYLIASMVGGFIGGLLGKAAPVFLDSLEKIFFHKGG